MEHGVDLGPNGRIVMAAKLLNELRDIIYRNGNNYTGMESPNIQSVLDVLMIPQNELIKQLSNIPEKYLATVEEVEGLKEMWEII